MNGFGRLLAADLSGSWRMLQKRAKLIFGGVLLTVMMVMALVGPLLWEPDPHEQVLRDRLRPPQWTLGSPHPLGTDHIGRDVLARLLWGARVSLLVGMCALAAAVLVGTVLGMTAGYYGGWLDFAVMKLVEFFMSLPAMLVAIAVMAVIGQGLWNLIAILAMTGWVGFCRQIRGEFLSLKGKEYVQSARAVGASDLRIMSRHLFVNTVPSLVVMGTFTLATMILAEASLSFLGVGVPPGTPTWGLMLNEGRDFLTRAPWLSLLPGAMIFMTVLAVNLLGDALRDHIDPRLRSAA